MAVPSAVAACTLTVMGEGLDRVTVKVSVASPVLPSVFDPSFTENAGTGSSLTMVPTPTTSAMDAPTGALRFMVKVSSNSYSVSPAMGTESVPPVVPGGRLSVPGVGV